MWCVKRETQTSRSLIEGLRDVLMPEVDFVPPGSRCAHSLPARRYQRPVEAVPVVLRRS